MRRAILSLLIVLGLVSMALAQDGYVGVYADAQGTAPCVSVPQWSGTTLFVVATLQGGTANGITGAEFRVEVSNPSGWYFTYNPPTGTTVLGSLMDTDPGNPSDGGATVAFASCQQGIGGKVALGTISVFNTTGTPTSLAVKRHGNPPNQSYSCPLFVVCDGPTFSKICMSSGSEPGCTLSKTIALNTNDPAVFVAGLNAIGGDENGEPGPPLPMPADPLTMAQMLLSNPIEPDIVGIEGEGQGSQAKVLADTLWLADWNFDGMNGTCNLSGWTAKDNLIENEGPNYWNPVNTQYAGQGYIINKAAALRADGCWATPGYGNRWDYSIKLKYKGTGSKLSFDYLLGSDISVTGFDGLSVEVDSASASNSLVNYLVRGDGRRPETYRVSVHVDEGTRLDGRVSLLTLPDFGAPNTEHSVLIRFLSSTSRSDEDGKFNSPIDAGLVVDNISITGGQLAYSENFEGTINPNVALINSGRSLAFGLWGRAFLHVTDNEKCPDNLTCSWLFTDPTKIASFADMAFGPGSAVVRDWSDQVIVSPWITLANGQPRGAVLSFREFPGNRFSQGRIARSWAIRGMYNGGTCITTWSGDDDPVKGTWERLDDFQWVTRVYDASQYMQPNWEKVQVRIRVADLQAVYGASPPATLNAGPGPFIDRIRFGRIDAGVVITTGQDTRTQAQDAFPTYRNSILPGEHFSPSQDRFGSCAFSMASDIGAALDESQPGSTNLITGDSIVVGVNDLTGGGIERVAFCYRVVSGPHTGKNVPESGANVLANGIAISEQVFNPLLASGTTHGFRMEVDDTYFRGGDVLQYFWFVKTGGANPVRSSYPPGINQDPSTLSGIASAEQLTGGLLEVNFLPKINWSAAYLARITADPTGDLDPTPSELANSTQANCILYVNKVNTARRSGSANRTSFMYTLDQLGYRGHYDVYDVQGFGNTNNDLGGRATIDQCTGYSLIIHDVGRMAAATIPNGGNVFDQKVDQATWYRNYLDSGLVSPVGRASLWVIGENWAAEDASNTLRSTYMAVSGPVDDQGFALNPNVEGQASFTFFGGAPTVNFGGDKFTLKSGCPAPRSFDGFGSSGANAVVVHKYKQGATLGHGAVVLNKNPSLKWNTIAMGFNWFDMYDPYCLPAAGIPCPNPTSVRGTLAGKILGGVLPIGCIQSGTTDVPPEELDVAPAVTALHQNTPNPFNPTTTIRFDLAEATHVQLRIFDVSGRSVRTLVSEEMPSQRYSIPWNATDDLGRGVASGIYFYTLQAGAYKATRKLVVMK